MYSAAVYYAYFFDTTKPVFSIVWVESLTAKHEVVSESESGAVTIHRLPTDVPFCWNSRARINGRLAADDVYAERRGFICAFIQRQYYAACYWQSSSML